MTLRTADWCSGGVMPHTRALRTPDSFAESLPWLWDEPGAVPGVQGPAAPRSAPGLCQERSARQWRAGNSFTPGPWQPVAVSRQEDVCDWIERPG